jgi:ppGpp synthetase/RelA/SpoT-type nucleotidyltranferase
VHVIINAALPYEVQVRTAIQHNWAQLSERLADRYGFELKYGGGPQHVAAALADFADLLAAIDQLSTDPYKEPDVALVGTIESYVERLPAIAEALKVQ